MFTKTIAVVAAVAAIGSAAPAPQAATATVGAPLVRTTNFGIAAKGQEGLTGFVLRAEALSPSDPNARALVFERPSAFTPSPVYLNGTADQVNTTNVDDFAYLNFVNPDKDCKDDFGVFLPDIGDGPGFDDPISAELGLGTPSFKVGNGQVFAKLNAAPNTFVACQRTLDNKSVLSLDFANFNENGSYPTGCSPISLEVVSLPTDAQ